MKNQETMRGTDELNSLHESTTQKDQTQNYQYFGQPSNPLSQSGNYDQSFKIKEK